MHANTPDFEDGDIESTPTQVEDSDKLSIRLVEAVRESGRCGLVDDAHHLQALHEQARTAKHATQSERKRERERESIKANQTGPYADKKEDLRVPLVTSILEGGIMVYDTKEKPVRHLFLSTGRVRRQMYRRTPAVRHVPSRKQPSVDTRIDFLVQNPPDSKADPTQA